jgi:AcrR family transcriptional regulator
VAAVNDQSGPSAVSTPTASMSPRKRYPKGLQRRQQILDRTIEVFADLGFENTSLRAIGEAIGVSHAALRRYFDTREELFLEVLREKDRQALAEARADDTPDIDFASHLDAYASQAPGLMALRHSMVARALEPHNEHSRAFFVERYEFLRNEALLVLRLAREAGTLRTDISPEAAASLVIAVIDGLSTQWLLDPRVDIHEGTVLFEQLLRPIPTP